jgi:orotate phosphoribosyltransferase
MHTSNNPPFADRGDAGRQLAERLSAYAGDSLMIFALPRGGVPVGAEIARSLERRSRSSSPGSSAPRISRSSASEP